MSDAARGALDGAPVARLSSRAVASSGRIRPSRAARAAGALALAAALLGPAPARAQIFNVQPLLAQNDVEGASGAVEGSLDWRTGNTSLFQASGSGIARYRGPSYLVFLLGRGEFGTGKKGVFLDRSLLHLRYRLELLDRFQPEVFVQHDRDELRRLRLRALAGCGPRVPIVRGDPVDLAAGASYLVELERVGADGGSSEVDETLDGRFSVYLALRASVSSTVQVAHTVYAQPRVDDPGDVRVLSETELIVALAGHVALKVAPSLAYDSRPPAGLDGVDTALKTSVQVHW